MKNGLKQFFGGTAPQQAGSGAMNPMAANGAGAAPPDPGLWDRMANGISSVMPDSAANKGVQYSYPNGQLPDGFGQGRSNPGANMTPVRGSVPNQGWGADRVAADGNPRDEYVYAPNERTAHGLTGNEQRMILRDATGYQGEFGDGRFQEWARQDPATKMAMFKALNQTKAQDNYLYAPTGGPSGPALGRPGGPGAADPSQLNEYGGITREVYDGGGMQAPRTPGLTGVGGALGQDPNQTYTFDPTTGGFVPTGGGQQQRQGWGGGR